ncbi:HesB/YadR/YfhF family protein [Vaginisenegalia massiliensis]|uniref:HesB/YadR/YfhF family protein n=1 Tax=Vaginisenegalia massiliensis TaxID=2058294 RepID=UPI000F54B49D|nr:iron-sulfur cluster biosynthesis protein [Vaginisenegalia massiliensis]
MKLTVEPQAAAWFKEEVGLSQGAGIRFLAKVYGCSPINSGFSLAMETNYPKQPAADFRDQEGIYYYIEESDLWFFDGYDLNVVYDEQLAEPRYEYCKNGQLLASQD